MKAFLEYKETGVEWIGTIPSHWETTRIKLLTNGEKSSFIDGDWVESPYITDSGIRLIQTGNVGIGKYKEQGFRYISDETFHDLNCTEVYPNDVLICRLASPVGRACLAPNFEVRMITAVDNCILKPAKSHDARYIVYQLSTAAYLEYLEYISRGSTRARISRSMLGNLEFIAPPLPEQRAIADFLDRKTAQINTLIEKKQRQIELLQEHRTALINQAVTKGLNPDAPMKDSGIEWLGEMPRHWETMMLKWIAYLQRGHDLPSDARIQGEYPIVSSSGISDYHNEPKAKGPGVVTGRYGTIGEVFYIEQDYWPLNTTLFVKNYFGNDERFTFYLLKILPFGAYSGKSAVPGIDRKDLHMLKLGCPPVPEQRLVAEYLDKVTEKNSLAINKINDEIELLQEYRTVLISAAVTGKIDVRSEGS